MGLKVGIQLYSVKNKMKENPLRTIEDVAEAGYLNLEVANHNALADDGVGFGVSAEELNALLEKNGSSVISAHIFPFTEENYKRIAEYNQKIGNHILVYPMDTFRDYDDAMRKAEMYEKMGKIAAGEGMTFLYHNHYQEFQKFRGKTVMEIILENTDPEHVNFELDTFWALRGGYDPVKVMEQFGTRIRMLHQKDYAQNAPNPVNMFDVAGSDTYITQEVFRKYKKDGDFIEIGYGQMDIQSIIDKALELGSIDYIVLEQDATELDELESIQRSMEGFRRFRGIDW